MAGRSVDIYIGAASPAHVGTAYFNGFGRRLSTTFSYDPAWLSSPAAFALAPDAPLSVRSSRFQGLPGFLSDAAPDRWGRHLVFRGAQNEAARHSEPMRSLDDVDYLLGVDDWSRMGALRLSLDEGATFLGQGTDVPKAVRLPELLAAARSVETGSDGWRQVKSLLDAGTSSLGGARPKATVSDDGTLWLAKFPSANDEWDVMAWEAWALDVAGQAGLLVPRHRLQRVGEHSVLMSARFDREDGERVPYLSALALLGLGDGADADYFDLADTLRTFSVRPKEDAQELFGRVALSVAIHNTDDHLRNHGLLHHAEGWRLSPLFDVNPNPFAAEERSLSILGERGDAETTALHALAEAMGIPAAKSRAIIAKVLGALDGWKARAKRLGCPKREIDLFAPVIDRRIEALASTF